jgi:AcrR family transcriptional regulator
MTAAPRRVSKRPAPGETQAGRETAARILKVTTRLLGERGYAGTSISAICEEGQVTAPSVYHLFGSKEGLLKAAIEDVAATWIEAQQRLYERASSAALDSAHALIESRIEILRQEMMQQPTVFRILYMMALERGHEDSEMLTTLRRVRAAFIADWDMVIRSLLPDRHPLLLRDGASLHLATLVLAIADGMFLSSQIEHDLHAVERLLDALRDLIMLAVDQQALPS